MPWTEQGGMNHGCGCRTAGVVLPAHYSPPFQRQHLCCVCDLCIFPAAWQGELLLFEGVIASIVYCHSSDEMTSLIRPESVRLYHCLIKRFWFQSLYPLNSS